MTNLKMKHLPKSVREAREVYRHGVKKPAKGTDVEEFLRGELDRHTELLDKAEEREAQLEARVTALEEEVSALRRQVPDNR